MIRCITTELTSLYRTTQWRATRASLRCIFLSTQHGCSLWACRSTFCSACSGVRVKSYGRQGVAWSARLKVLSNYKLHHWSMFFFEISARTSVQRYTSTLSVWPPHRLLGLYCSSKQTRHKRPISDVCHVRIKAFLKFITKFAINVHAKACYVCLNRLFQNPIGLVLVLLFLGIYLLLFVYARRKDKLNKMKVLFIFMKKCSVFISKSFRLERTDRLGR